MRILFAFAGGRGHAEPLVPVARAAADAGHEVAFAGRGSVVAALGFDGFTLGAEAPVERIPLRPIDMEREERVLRDGFAGRIARQRTADLLSLADGWRPDAVVCDETDFGSMVAAERLGLPHATVLVTAAGSFVRAEVVGAALDALRAAYGLPPDPELAMPARDLVLSPFPPGFRDPAFPLPATARSFRPAVRSGAAGEAVYVTLGTVFPPESGDLLSRVLAGLRELGREVIATVGPHVEPAELGPLPERIRVERFVPQAELLPRCAAVVSHAGSGTVAGALAHGLPQVATPLGADQPLNAGRIDALGLGRVLDALTATPEEIRDAVSTVLDEPSYRAAAARLRDEYAALPGPESTVPLLERLV